MATAMHIASVENDPSTWDLTVAYAIFAHTIPSVSARGGVAIYSSVEPKLFIIVAWLIIASGRPI